ncbi:MAG: sugar ABC transporter permease [Proteobacteria bacterium]|jgi:multiple sugar transport system permease protein|nr:sugar ABC transporter permease [Pseudomonadota bacterium]MDA0855507.1 sugar ABC transporter permease [Pseudomonadota bacterium]
MKKRHKEILLGYLFLLPALALLSLFFLYPLINVFWMSFHKWPVFGKPKWLGLDNFYFVLTEPNFWMALKFTLYYTLTVTPMLFIVAFVSALICNAKMFGTTLFRSMYFLPVVMSFATASFIWIWLYSEMYGVLVYLIKWLGIVQEDEFNVFSTGETAMWAVNIMVTWKFSGIQMIILIAGMQSIRDDFYEASTLMGASRLQNIIYITAPLLKHSTALALVISIAGSIQAFEQFFIMTAGGPANQTRTLMMLTVDTAFDYFKLGPASAMSIFIMMILLFLTVVQLKLFRR